MSAEVFNGFSHVTSRNLYSAAHTRTPGSMCKDISHCHSEELKSRQAPIWRKAECIGGMLCHHSKGLSTLQNFTRMQRGVLSGKNKIYKVIDMLTLFIVNSFHIFVHCKYKTGQYFLAVASEQRGFDLLVCLVGD